MEVRQKAKIIAVGYIINGKLENWKFDCIGLVPALEVTADQQVLIAGYTMAELEQISEDYWGKDAPAFS